LTKPQNFLLSANNVNMILLLKDKLFKVTNSGQIFNFLHKIKKKNARYIAILGWVRYTYDEVRQEASLQWAIGIQSKIYNLKSKISRRNRDLSNHQ